MATVVKTRPDWNRLHEIAAGQCGHFTTRQAADAAYSVQLLRKHVAAGRIQRVRRGIYRLVHYPAGEHEDLVALWLWSDMAGVFSHETALFLHELSDALPWRIHMTLPAKWEHRRLRVPKGVTTCWAEVNGDDLSWSGPVPVTAPRRTIADCIAAGVAPDLTRQAMAHAARRGMIWRADSAHLRKLLAARERAAA
jgi:predicted transcriptional regulator of viral defense system